MLGFAILSIALLSQTAVDAQRLPLAQVMNWSGGLYLFCATATTLTRRRTMEGAGVSVVNTPTTAIHVDQQRARCLAQRAPLTISRGSKLFGFISFRHDALHRANHRRPAADNSKSQVALIGQKEDNL
jgi:hypothetical protein